MREFIVVSCLWVMLSAISGAQKLQPFPQINTGGYFYGTTTSQYIADFDQNGMADIVGIYFDPAGAPGNTVGAVMNPGITPTTGFTNITPARVLPPGPNGANGAMIATGDFDGDGNRDILISIFVIVASTGSIQVQVLPGNGSGGFGAPANFIPPIVSSQFGKRSVLDFNGDGIKDLVIFRTAPSAGFDVYSGGPNGGTLVHSQTLTGSTSFHPSYVGDFDGNGCDDLLYTDSGSPSGWMLARGAVAPTFPAPQPMMLPFTPSLLTPISVGDFDADGASDVLMVQNYLTPSATVRVAFGDATASMASTITIAPPPVPTGFTYFQLLASPVRDIDSDGINDIIFRFFNLQPSRVALGAFRGIGNRTVSPSATLLWTAPAPVGSNGVGGFEILEDFDGDGDVDIFFVDTSNQLSAPPYEINYIENLARVGAGCPGSTGTPRADVGAAYPGNAGFALEVTNALPFAPAVCGVAIANAPTTGCGIILDLDPASVILPSGMLGFTVADALGKAVFPAPIPPLPAFVGFEFFHQWAVLDPQGAFIYDSAPFALSGGRAVTVF